jgi:hypothetical protein
VDGKGPFAANYSLDEALELVRAEEEIEAHRAIIRRPGPPRL